MDLPLTYYESLRTINPLLFKYLKKELTHAKNNYSGAEPFHSLEQFSENYNNYINEYFDRLEENPYETYKYLQDEKNVEALTKWLENDYLTVFNFELFGRKTFFITENLAENLAFTDYNVSGEFLLPPFDCFLLVFNDHLTKNLFFNLIKKDDRHYDDAINVFATKIGTGSYFILRLYIKFQQSHLERSLFVNKDLKIEEILKTDWEDLLNNSDTHEESIYDKESKFFYETGFEFFRIIVNSVIYLTSSSPDIVENKMVVSSRKRKKLKKNSEHVEINTRSFDYYEVGKNVGSIMIDKNKVDTNSYELEKQFYKINVKFIVRGHWRNQPYGVNKEQRKLIFIKPYYKGPDLSDVINKPYIVK